MINSVPPRSNATGICGKDSDDGYRHVIQPPGMGAQDAETQAVDGADAHVRQIFRAAGGGD